MDYLPKKGGYSVHNILTGPGFNPVGSVSGAFHKPPQIETPEAHVPKFYGSDLNSTGSIIIKKRKAPRVTSFEQPKRAPGMFPTTIGDAGQAGLGVDSYHEFKPAQGLQEAIALANQQGEQASMPHQWIKPEHMTYTGDKTNESALEYFQNVSQDFQRDKIEKMMAKGYGEEEIRRVLDKEREKSIAKALKDPSNPSALLQAQLAKSLPDYFQPDYPMKISPGAVSIKKDASAYELATGQFSQVQRAKRFEAKQASLQNALQTKAEDKQSNELERRLRSDARQKMQSTVSQLPTGSGVLDMLRRQLPGLGPQISFD